MGKLMSVLNARSLNGRVTECNARNTAVVKVSKLVRLLCHKNANKFKH